MAHLKSHLEIKGIKRVVMHEPLTNLRKVLFLQMAHGTPQSEVWRALNGATTLQAQIDQQQERIRKGISERNARFFEMEADKLDGWADDLKVGLERELKDLERQIKEARRVATVALTLEEKLAGQKAVKALEAERSNKRRSLFDAQDRIDAQRADLIAQIEGKLDQKVGLDSLFTIRWRLE